MTEPLLSTIVVSWGSHRDAAELATRFPSDARHELLLVDNDGALAGREFGANVRLFRPVANLGFAGGSNLGARHARAPRLLFLNPDTEARPGAYDAVLDALTRWPDAGGCAPRLVDEAGVSQHAWQLRPLPAPAALLAHAFFWDPSSGGRGGGARSEPPSGAAIEQPAGAALALRRDLFEALGGFDERFHPAWFEDVDLARRLAARGERLLYSPEATFVHRRSASLATLGYGAFLLAYDRNLALYLRLHHGRGWELLFRALVPLGALARLALLPLRRPQRAPTRRAAAAALLGAARGALSGWREQVPSPPRERPA